MRLRHMLDSSREAIEFLGSTSRDALADDRMRASAVVRAIEVVGEAASKVTAETRAAHPGVPWSVITAMRNRLIHGYFDIDYERVWDTTRADLPVLIAELERILASDPPA